MSTNYHDVIPFAAPANSSVFNSRLSQLDEAITTNTTGIDTLDTALTNLKNGVDSIRRLRLDPATTLTIAAGVITVTQSAHKVETQASASADDLDTITPPTDDDVTVITLWPEDASHVVTVKHNTGNIYLSGEADVKLDNLRKSLTLRYDGTKWCEDIHGVAARTELSSTYIAGSQLVLPTNAVRQVGLGVGNNKPLLSVIPRPIARLHVMEKAAAATYAQVGMAAGTSTGAGSLTENNGTDNVYVRQAIAGSTGTFGGRRSTTFDLVRRQYNPYFSARLKVDSVANLRLWVGLFSAAVTNVDTIAGATEAMAFRFSTVAGDAGWMGLCKDASTQSTPVQISSGVSADTAYTLEMWVDSANGVVFFSVNGSTLASVSSNLPTTTTELGWIVTAITTTNSAKNFDFNHCYVEFG